MPIEEIDETSVSVRTCMHRETSKIKQSEKENFN